MLLPLLLLLLLLLNGAIESAACSSETQWTPRHLQGVSDLAKDGPSAGFSEQLATITYVQWLSPLFSIYHWLAPFTSKESSSLPNIKIHPNKLINYKEVVGYTACESVLRAIITSQRYYIHVCMYVSLAPVSISWMRLMCLNEVDSIYQVNYEFNLLFWMPQQGKIQFHESDQLVTLVKLRPVILSSRSGVSWARGWLWFEFWIWFERQTSCLSNMGLKYTISSNFGCVSNPEWGIELFPWRMREISRVRCRYWIIDACTNNRWFSSQSSCFEEIMNVAIWFHYIYFFYFHITWFKFSFVFVFGSVLVIEAEVEDFVEKRWSR